MSASAENGRGTEPIPRLAFDVKEAAATLGMGEDWFREHVLPELRTTRRGRIRLIDRRELERWLDRSSARGEW